MLHSCAPLQRGDIHEPGPSSAGAVPGQCTAPAPRTNRDWWPTALQHRRAAPQFRAVRPDGQGFRLREGVQEPRPQGAEQGPARADDAVAGLVAGRLRPLRRPDDPPRLARRRHLSHHRRPRRRRRGPAALRAAQLLAGQREPRQGAPAAVADQAEVRPQDLLGRPDGARRQCRARVDGLQDLRLRRRPRRRLGTGRAVLGSRGQLARRRTLQRRARACRPARRRADGPHLRQPGRPERQPGSARRRATSARPSRAWR